MLLDQTLPRPPEHRTPCPSLAMDCRPIHNTIPGDDRYSLKNPQAKKATTTSIASPEATASMETDPLQDVYRAPLEIPGRKKKIYVFRHADARIGETYRKRFDQIIDLFKQKLLTVKALSKSKPTDTLYKLKMCGPNPKDARPSILIYHGWIDKDVGKHLWKNLTEKTLREQYEGTDPVFKIYLFFSNAFMMLGNPSKALSIYADNNAIVGAPLVSEDTLYQVSTITCGVSFSSNNAIFALTSAHAFEHGSNNMDVELDFSHNDSTTELGSLGTDDTSEYSLASTDDEYDWDELEAAAERERQEAGLDHPNEPRVREYDGKREHTGVSEIKPKCVWGRANDAKQENLDWALVELPSLDQQNLFMEPSCPSQAIGPVGVATTSGFFQGTLSSIPSYLANSRNSTSWAKIWTFTLDNDSMH